MGGYLSDSVLCWWLTWLHCRRILPHLVGNRQIGREGFDHPPLDTLILLCLSLGEVHYSSTLDVYIVIMQAKPM